MKGNRFGYIALLVFTIVALVTMALVFVLGVRTRTHKNLEIADRVIKVYIEGRSKGVNWDTSSEVTMVRDVIDGRYCTSGAFRGNIFGGDISGVTNPDPKQIAEFIILDDEGYPHIFDPTK